MNKTKEESGRPSLGGRDARRQRAGHLTGAAELRELIRQMRSKSSVEVLGLSKEHGLARATTIATIGTALTLALFTVGPYFWNKAFAQPVEQAAVPATAPAAVVAPGATTPPATDAKTPGADGSAASAGQSMPRGLEKEFPELETKESDPTVNPLEDAADNLLDDLR